MFSTDTGLSTAGAHAYSFRKVFPANLYPSSGPVSVSGGGDGSQSGRGGVLWVFPEHSVGVSSRRPRCVDVLVQVFVRVCVRGVHVGEDVRVSVGVGVGGCGRVNGWVSMGRQAHGGES